MIRSLLTALLVALLALLIVLAWDGTQRADNYSAETHRLLTDARAALEKLRRELTATQNAAARTAQELQQARADRDQHAAQISDLQLHLQHTQQEAATLATTTHTLEQVQTALRDALSRATQAEHELVELQTTQGQTADRVAALETTLATAEEEARQRIQLLSESLQAAAARASTFEQVLAAAESDNVVKAKTISALESQLENTLLQIASTRAAGVPNKTVDQPTTSVDSGRLQLNLGSRLRVGGLSLELADRQCKRANSFTPIWVMTDGMRAPVLKHLQVGTTRRFQGYHVRLIEAWDNGAVLEVADTAKAARS